MQINNKQKFELENNQIDYSNQVNLTVSILVSIVEISIILASQPLLVLCSSTLKSSFSLGSKFS